MGDEQSGYPLLAKQQLSFLRPGISIHGHLVVYGAMKHGRKEPLFTGRGPDGGMGNASVGKEGKSKLFRIHQASPLAADVFHSQSLFKLEFCSSSFSLSLRIYSDASLFPPSSGGLPRWHVEAMRTI